MATTYTVRLYELTGNSVKVIETKSASSFENALSIFANHANTHGYSNVKTVDDEGYGELRVTATTPNGRAGRNIGTMTPDIDW